MAVTDSLTDCKTTDSFPRHGHFGSARTVRCNASYSFCWVGEPSGTWQRMGPSMRSAPLKEGLRLRDARRWKAAIDQFESAVAAEPDSSDAWYWLAVTSYGKAIELGLPNAKAARAWTWLASSLSKTGEPKKALRCLEEAAALGGYRPKSEYDEIRLAVERRCARAIRRGTGP